MIGVRETLNQSKMNFKLKEFTLIEIVDRISSSLTNLPMGIGAEVGINYTGCDAPYVYAKIDGWEEAAQEANADTDSIDGTFWGESWSITSELDFGVVTEILEEIDTKTLAYFNYFQKKMEEVERLYEEEYGECAEWAALDKSKMQIIAIRKDYYNNFRDEFCKDDNIVILRTPNDIPF